MSAGAKGCQVIIAGKITGARHRTEKFTEGHIKFCGEIVKKVMDFGFSEAKLKAGVLGVKVRIMKPNAVLPDEIELKKPEVKKEQEKEPEKKNGKPVKKKPAAEKTVEKKPAEKPQEIPIKELLTIPRIGPSIIKKFEKVGVKTLEEVFEMTAEEISEIEGIGMKTAENIIKELRKILK